MLPKKKYITKTIYTICATAKDAAWLGRTQPMSLWKWTMLVRRLLLFSWICWGFYFPSQRAPNRDNWTSRAPFGQSQKIGSCSLAWLRFVARKRTWVAVMIWSDKSHLQCLRAKQNKVRCNMYTMNRINDNHIKHNITNKPHYPHTSIVSCTILTRNSLLNMQSNMPWR